MDKNSLGFTVLEMLIVLVVVGILAGLGVIAIADSRAKARDVERVTDIDNLSSRLEEYHNDKGGYPNTFGTTTFGGLDPEALKDPDGNSVTIASAEDNQLDAENSSNPTSTNNYKYIPYPTGCNSINCTGYVLKSYIEKPQGTLANPYVKTGTNNN